MPKVNEVFSKDSEFCRNMRQQCDLIGGCNKINGWLESFGISLLFKPAFIYVGNGYIIADYHNSYIRVI